MEQAAAAARIETFEKKTTLLNKIDFTINNEEEKSIVVNWEVLRLIVIVIKSSLC